MTDKNFEAELNDVITRNLPAHVSKVLQQRLELVTELEEKLERQDNTLAKNADSILKLTKETTDLKALLKKHEDLDKREAEIRDRETKLNETLAFKDTQCAYNIVGKYEALMQMIFKNPMHRESVFTTDTGQMVNGVW